VVPLSAFRPLVCRIDPRFNLLDSRIMPEDPHCTAAVLTKTLADQILFAPLGLLMFFAVIKCLEGRPRDLPHTLRNRYGN
jgi:hypothetical protein